MRTRKIRGLTPPPLRHLTNLRGIQSRSLCGLMNERNELSLTDDSERVTCGQCITLHNQALGEIAEREEYDRLVREREEEERAKTEAAEDNPLPDWLTTPIACENYALTLPVGADLTPLVQRWLELGGRPDAGYQRNVLPLTVMTKINEYRENAGMDPVPDLEATWFMAGVTHTTEGTPLDPCIPPLPSEEEQIRLRTNAVARRVAPDIGILAAPERPSVPTYPMTRLGMPDPQVIDNLRGSHRAVVFGQVLRDTAYHYLRTELTRSNSPAARRRKAIIFALAEELAGEMPELEVGQVVEGYNRAADVVRGVVVGGGQYCNVYVLSGGRERLMWPTVRALQGDRGVDLVCPMNGAVPSLSGLNNLRLMLNSRDNDEAEGV